MRRSVLCNLRPARRSEAACPLREGEDTGDLTDKDMTKGQSIRGDKVFVPPLHCNLPLS